MITDIIYSRLSTNVFSFPSNSCMNMSKLLYAAINVYSPFHMLPSNPERVLFSSSFSFFSFEQVKQSSYNIAPVVIMFSSSFIISSECLL